MPAKRDPLLTAKGTRYTYAGWVRRRSQLHDNQERAAFDRAYPEFFRKMIDRDNQEADRIYERSRKPAARKPAISKMSVREIEDELRVGYHVARAYGDSPRRTRLQTELKKRQHAKFAKEDRERAKKQRHEEAERKLRVRGQSSRAKAPVRRALAEAEKARKHMFTVVDMRQRGKATWDDVRDAETAWRHASDLFTESYRAYESKYHTTYVN